MYSYNFGRIKFHVFDKANEWKADCFTSFSIVFQPYQEDGRVIMKICMQWNPG